MFADAKKETYFKSFVSKISPRQIVILAFIFALLIPFPTTIVPEWKIRAVDESGNPFAGAGFRQSWNHYSYDISGQEFREVDENGYVVFPERTFTAPLIYRVVRSGLAYLLLLAHGSVGSSASVNATTDKCSSEHLEYELFKSLPNVAVLKC